MQVKAANSTPITDKRERNNVFLSVSFLWISLKGKLTPEFRASPPQTIKLSYYAESGHVSPGNVDHWAAA